MKIIVFVLNALIQLAAAAFGFLILIISMNGYSESQATPGIILYIVWSIVSALLLGATGIYGVKFLLAKTSLGNFSASAITVLSLAIAGIVALVIGFFAAIILTEALRK